MDMDIEVNEEDLKELEQLYTEAIALDLPRFDFKNRVIYTGYAKYLIEYLKIRFKKGVVQQT